MRAVVPDVLFGLFGLFGLQGRWPLPIRSG